MIMKVSYLLLHLIFCQWNSAYAMFTLDIEVCSLLGLITRCPLGLLSVETSVKVAKLAAFIWINSLSELSPSNFTNPLKTGEDI